MIIFYVESVTDACTSPSVVARPFNCDICEHAGVRPVPTFATEKALNSHKRISHQSRCTARLYVDSSAVCPICRVKFSTRLRAIAHLSDRRRVKCSSQLSSLVPLRPDVVAELDLKDAEARKAAQRSGHTQPLSAHRAVTSDGRRVGRAQCN